MKNNRCDESLCLHQIESYWWMDKRCFLMLAEYLGEYDLKARLREDGSFDRILFALLGFDTLFTYRKLFAIKRLGEKSLLLSFAYPEEFTEPGKTMDFEYFYENNGNVQTMQVSFFR